MPNFFVFYSFYLRFFFTVVNPLPFQISTPFSVCTLFSVKLHFLFSFSFHACFQPLSAFYLLFKKLLFVPHRGARRGKWKYLSSVCACCEYDKFKNKWNPNFHFGMFVFFSFFFFSYKVHFQTWVAKSKTKMAATLHVYICKPCDLDNM